MKIIRPELPAAKVAKLRNFESPKFEAAVKAQPRLLELLWFLQWHSLQPGGMDKFCAGFIERNAARLGTPAMRRFGKIDQPYSAVERQEIIGEFPYCELWNVFDSPPSEESERIISQFNEEMRGSADPFAFRISRPNLAFVNKQNHAYFADYCKKIALAKLPTILYQFCAAPDATIPDVFYFRELQTALIGEMDAHAARVLAGLAPTVVAKQVLSGLEFARSENAAVKINGNPRFGKTETVLLYCMAFPGRARLVLTPQSNSDHDLIAAIAESLGAENTLQTTQRELKERVEFTLRHSGLMMVFDEAHYLIPQRYTRTSPPMRLNWIRGNLMDRQCPVALITTPQGFDGARRKFVHTTGYNVDQFNGRIAREVNLPEELSPADLRLVVDVRFPGLPESFVQRIIGHALSSSSYVFAVEKICKNARHVAREREEAATGTAPENPKITPPDLEKGIELAGFHAPLNPMLKAPRQDAGPAPAQRTTAARRNNDADLAVIQQARPGLPGEEIPAPVPEPATVRGVANTSAILGATRKNEVLTPS